ncbi:4462_t:CDS:2, partial [Entrophospora sp. SA101]
QMAVGSATMIESKKSPPPRLNGDLVFGSEISNAIFPGSVKIGKIAETGTHCRNSGEAAILINACLT